MHFVPWHVRPKGGFGFSRRGLELGLFSSKIGSTGEFYVWCNLFSRFNFILKELVWPNSQTFQLQPEGFLHSMLLQVIASQPSSWAPVTVHPTVGVDKNQEQHGAIIEPALLKLDFSCSPLLCWISPIASWCHMVLLNL